MTYSLSQAATATGKDRSTIQRAIKNGKISATLNETGAYQIDPAELHRVFPVVAMPDAPPVALQQSATALQWETEGENRELRAKVELLREMVDDLRGRLDNEAEERRRLTLLLTDKRPPTAPPQPEPEPPHSAYFFCAAPWLWVFLAIAASGATAWLYFTKGQS